MIALTNAIRNESLAQKVHVNVNTVLESVYKNIETHLIYYAKIHVLKNKHVYV
jgi:hypothetical protein